jgi:VanZ family protein
MLENRPVRILLKLPAFLIALIIWVLSSQSTLPHIKGVLGLDKLQHFLGYAVLAAATGLWVPRAGWKERGTRYFFLIVAIASIYGLIDEIHQSFVPGRDASVWDWMADTLGAFAGTGLVAVVLRKLRQNGPT